MIAASHRYTHTPRENFEELCGTLITSEVQLQQQEEEEEQRQLHRPLGDPKRRRESRQKFHCSRRAKSCRQVDFKWPLLPFSPPFHAPAFLLAQSLALTTPLSPSAMPPPTPLANTAVLLPLMKCSAENFCSSLYKFAHSKGSRKE